MREALFLRSLAIRRAVGSSDQTVEVALALSNLVAADSLAQEALEIRRSLREREHLRGPSAAQPRARALQI